VSGLLVSAIAQGFIAGLGYVIIGVWLLLCDLIGAGLALLAYGAFIVHPTDNILKPLLISNATHIPLVIVPFGVMGGLIAFGVVGLFLGPLVLAVLLAIWREWLDENGPSVRHCASLDVGSAVGSPNE
jgi:predicted PurR-regulated permease PerM